RCAHSRHCLRRRRERSALRRGLPRRECRCRARRIDLPFWHQLCSGIESKPPFRRHPGALAMLIPSIDIMGGKIVQLVQGEKKALEFDDFDYWINRFAEYPLVQLIDLDAAMGNGNNHQLIAMVCKRLPCQVGGGIRNCERAAELLELGARKVILGSALLTGGKINLALAQECAD